jgi:hypothetical protein
MDEKPATAEPVKPKRCWFSFSLRALLIGVMLLSIPLGWFGWQAKIVRDRAAMRDELESNGSAFVVGLDSHFFDAPPVTNWLRRLIGDEDILEIWFRPKPDGPGAPEGRELERIQTAFPEARIVSCSIPPVG